MSQQISPFLEGKYGWNYGEAGWHLGADENWLKFSYLHDGNVDSIVSSLPAASNGAAHFLTTDSRFYFSIGTTWYSSPCPKWFIFKIKSTGVFWQFDGTSAVEISNPTQANAALEALQDVVADLGTAAFQTVEYFATQSELDVAVANAAAYTDALRTDLADSVDGSDLVGFRGRTVYEKLNQLIDIRDFGAVGNYIPTTNTGTDDTTAFQNALDYIESIGGGALYVPKGIYKITAALSIQDVPLLIIGDGADNSLIAQTTASANGLNFTSTIYSNRVDGAFGHGGRAITLGLQDLTIAATVQAGRAINVSMTAYTQNFPALSLTRVEVKSLYSTTAGFQYGLYGHNLNGIEIDGFYFMGDAGNAATDSATPYYSEAGIRLTGDDPTGLISHYWRGLTIYCANRGVWVEDHYEGFYIQQFEFVFVGTGFSLNPSTLTNFHLENGHIDFKATGVYGENISGFHSVNVDYLKQGGVPISPEPITPGHNISLFSCNEVSVIGGRCWSFSAASDSNGIFIANSTGVIVQGVNLKGMNSLNFGVALSNTSNGVVSNCTIEDAADGVFITGTSSELIVNDNAFKNLAGGSNRFGVVFDTAVTNCSATGNIGVTGVDLIVVNSGTGNYIYDNTGTSAHLSGFASGDATPAIDVTGAKTFVTANAGATSITTFDGGYSGMEINLISGDNNTTIVHSAAVSVPIITKTAANIAFTTNKTARFVRGSGAWYEV